MPTYNPKDMAYVLQMTKASGKYSPEELALMQGVNQAMGGGMTGMPQGQPMNRLAQIQAAANQVMSGQENPEGQRMANIANYFQGRQ